MARATPATRTEFHQCHARTPEDGRPRRIIYNLIYRAVRTHPPYQPSPTPTLPDPSNPAHPSPNPMSYVRAPGDARVMVRAGGRGPWEERGWSRVAAKGGEEDAIRKTWPIYYRAQPLNGLRVFASDFGKPRFSRTFCHNILLLRNIIN